MDTNTGLKNNTGFKASDSTLVTEKIHYLGQLRIVGQVVERISDKEPIGYVVMNEKTQKFKMYTVEQTMSLLTKFKFVNAQLERKSEKEFRIVNTECAMDSLPKFNTHMEVVDNYCFIVLGEIISDNKTIGYRILDTKAQVFDAKESDLVKFHNNGGKIVNAKIVNKNDKQIVSGIKSEFTKIERKDIPNLKLGMTPADEWRHKKRVEKYLNYYIPHILRYMFGLSNSLESYNGHFYTRKYRDDTDMRGTYYDFNVDKEKEIILNEVLIPENGINIPADDMKKLLEIKKLPHAQSKYDSKGFYKGFTTSEEEMSVNIYLCALAQFALYNTDIRNRVFNKYSVKYFNERKAKEAFDQLKEFNAVSKVALSAIKELLEHSKEEEKAPDMSKEFKTTTFTKPEDIAQLGFAITEANRAYEFKTEAGFTKKLKFIGDVLTNNEGYSNNLYQQYMELSRCLGDILIVADLHKLINKCISPDNLPYGCITYDEFIAYMEMLIAIAYIYSSEAVKTYVEHSREYLDVIGVAIPDYEELSTTDYKLSPIIKLYYSSGFNVFLKDDFKYKHDYLDRAKYINYRQLGVNHNIRHPALQGELASIVNMVTSDKCTTELIDRLIGKLRFI